MTSVYMRSQGVIVAGAESTRDIVQDEVRGVMQAGP